MFLLWIRSTFPKVGLLQDHHPKWQCAPQMLFLWGCTTISVWSCQLPLHPREGWEQPQPCQQGSRELSEQEGIISPSHCLWSRGRKGVRASLGRSGPSAPGVRPRRCWQGWRSAGCLLHPSLSEKDGRALCFPLGALALPCPTCAQQRAPLFRAIRFKNSSETTTEKSGGKLYFTQFWYLLSEGISSIDSCVYRPPCA